MENNKKKRRIKTWILVGLTLLIVAAVVLIIYFVNKNDVPPVSIAVGESFDAGKYVMTAQNVEFEREFEDIISAGGDKVAVKVSIKFEASADVTIKASQFSINGFDVTMRADGKTVSKLKIEEGKALDVEIYCAVAESMSTTFLQGKGVKVALGAAIISSDGALVVE